MREDKKEIYDKFKIQNLKEEIKGLLDLSNEDILEYLGIESIDEQRMIELIINQLRSA